MAIQQIGNGADLTVQITSGARFFNPAVTNLSDGRFALMWSDDEAGTWDTRTQVIGQTSFGVPFNAEGNAFVNSFDGALDQFRFTTDVAYAWTEFVGGTQRVFHAIMSPEGVVRLNRTQVDHGPFAPVPGNPSFSDFDPEVVTHENGNYVVGMESFFITDAFGFPIDRDVNAVRFDGNGNQMNFNIPFDSINDTADQRDLAITALTNNRTVLVWSTNSPVNTAPNTYGTDTNGPNGLPTFGLRAAIYDADGNQVRDVQLVNAVDMPANAGNGDQIEASVATLANGDFVVTWTDNSLSKTDNSGSAIFARIFDTNGIPRGASFQVNTTTAGGQADSDVAALSGGGFVVTWTDPSGANTDIRARAFTANGTATDATDKVVNSITGGNQRDSEVVGGNDNTFMVTWQDDSSAPNGSAGFFPSSVRFKLMIDSTGSTPSTTPQITQPIPQIPRDPTPILEEEIRGTNFADPNLDGNVLDNIIHGLGGNDRIRGLQGNDEIHGDRGRDTLTGNSGEDVFVFDTRPNRTNNWDKITDFSRARDDIWLESQYFSKLGGSVSASELRFGKEAQDKNDYLIYDRSTGKLYYDSDGNGAKDQVLFAQLTNKATIRATDFDII